MNKMYLRRGRRLEPPCRLFAGSGLPSREAGEMEGNERDTKGSGEQ